MKEKKNQHSTQPKNVRLDSELLAQLYLAYYLDMPSEAKNQKTLVFGDKYDDIFDEDIITANRLLLPYKIYLPLELQKREIQKLKRTGKKLSYQKAFLSFAIYHLLNSVKIIALKEDLDLSEDKIIKIAISKAIKYLKDIVKDEKNNRGDEYTHESFFKAKTTNKIVRDYINSKYKNM